MRIDLLQDHIVIQMIYGHPIITWAYVDLSMEMHMVELLLIIVFVLLSLLFENDELYFLGMLDLSLIRQA